MYKVRGYITCTDIHIVTNITKSIEKFSIPYIASILIKSLNCQYSVSNQPTALPFTGVV